MTEFDTAFANHLKERAIRGRSVNFLLGWRGGPNVFSKGTVEL